MTILIENLTIDAVIGILPNEREKPQRLIASAAIDYDYKNSAEFVDYALVADLIALKLVSGRFGLLEEAIEAIATEILRLNPSIQKLRLCIEKPDISPNFRVKVFGDYLGRDRL
ncbi:MAG: dihydroneopterin aldolase [Helicobacteraceae bacterium]|jgi:dihydroneopterin aldolase|nr:dihydroneopterin aldolase [Helicobacteraceae bacterium]